MAGFSDYLENKILDVFFRGQAVTPPAAVYLALYTAAPTDAGGGTEVSGSGYARQAIPMATAASGGIVSNTGIVSFTAVGGAFGTITHVGVFDAATGGNLLSWDDIAPITINSGDTLDFPVGELDFSQD
ncbi:hypothetical protein EN780_07870 [Mesorhizobium sp. M4B.F.Ca.ET.089.01.1.1]|uniref:phage tail fiber protein n=1 Tax=Mesorhizobium sp. M4B.F.Ca.ET.089.01.1.1 TaxID=2496662 RepID=UPI000FE4152A|nr:hypothetical protein [Mesorhizobium sp. M4B.F.Ca.ET.089.01.1.1]RWX68932.1 hypothetical protein EN780_07870 [Mesorhizobium sp. M4B.F.Ca.ET.089.01.1.1]